MMRGRRLSLFSLAVLALLLLPAAGAWACACCSDEGDYDVRTSRPSDYELSLMQQIRFGRTAHLYLTPAEDDGSAKGLAHRAEQYAVGGSLVGGVWKLAFREGKQT